MQTINKQKEFVNEFETKSLEEYHDLYFQGDTVLLADIFKSFRNMCLKIYELDPARFFSVPR